MSKEKLIAHAFVHAGVESEYFKKYGKIDGYGINIQNTINFDNYFELDLMNNQLNKKYDFGFFQPKCQKWARATVDKGKEPNQIKRARKLAKKYCDYWIIENVPKAPLKDTVILNGTMFDKEIRYERAFESNFSIPQPEYEDSQKHNLNVSEMRKIQAGNIKGYTTGYYHVKTLKRNCIPRYYLEYLLKYCPAIEN